MSKNTVVRGMLVPSLKNKPLDGRMDVPTLDDIVNIENPYVNFIFPVAETGMWYKVTRLTDKVIDELVIPDGEIAEYETFGEGMTDKQKEDYLLKSLAEQLYLKKEDASQMYLNKETANADFLKKVDAELEYLKKEDAARLYQPKGDYQPAGDYATNKALNDLRNEVNTKECSVEVVIGENEPSLNEVKLWVDTSSTSDDTGGDDTGGEDGEGGGDVNPDTPSKQYETLNLVVSASDGASITATINVNGSDVAVTSTSSYSLQIEYGTEYTITPQAVSGYATPEPLTFVAGQEIRTVTLNYIVPLITTILFDQSFADPDYVVTRTVDNGGIEAIRANSHRYTGKLNSEGVMELKQLNDVTSLVYADGSSSDLTGGDGDVWMKLPRFFYKAEKLQMPNPDYDMWNVSFAYGAKPDGTWNEWDGKELIGVYRNVQKDGILYSHSGSESLALNTTKDPKSRGEGFDFCGYKHHCIIIWLSVALYDTHDTTHFITIDDSVAWLNGTGFSDNRGMSDTEASENLGYTNIWGLENWISESRYESIGVTATIKYLDESIFHISDGDTIRDYEGPVLWNSGWSTTYDLGLIYMSEMLDVLPKQLALQTRLDLGYKSQMPCYIHSVSGDAPITEEYYIRRGYTDLSKNSRGIAGIFSLSASGTIDATRLVYHGDYIEI